MLVPKHLPRKRWTKSRTAPTDELAPLIRLLAEQLVDEFLEDADHPDGNTSPPGRQKPVAAVPPFHRVSESEE